MGDKRNAWIDITRVAAAVGIVLCHVDLTAYGAVGLLFGQFLSPRFSVLFFLAVIGFYLEKSDQAGKRPVLSRVCSLSRVYGVWSLIYLALSFVMVVLIQKMSLGQFLMGKVKDFFFSGSYYHFWFYPAVIYALLFIGGVKKLLGDRALRLLVPLALTLYVVGLLGTAYLPIGRQIPILRNLYEAETFEAVMHLGFLGFPAIVFGMAAARKSRECPGYVLLLAAAVYVGESVVLCLCLGWRENPQMLISSPLLTVQFLHWAQNRTASTGKINPVLCRTVSSGIYNVHPLFLAAFAFVLPELDGMWCFALCLLCSALFGWVLYCFRKIKFFGLFT